MIQRFNPLPRNSKPLKRSFIQPKKRERKVSWRSNRVREDAEGMRKLREAAFARSRGICECGLPDCELMPMKLRRVTWNYGHLHHLRPNKSDVLERVRYVLPEHHKILTGELQWRKKRAA